MSTSHTERATLTVPTDYLEDARSALIREVKRDGDALRTDCTPEDQAGSARILGRTVQLIEQLDDATGKAELTAVHDTTSAPLIHLLEAMVDVFAERLRHVAQYGPIPMGDVLDLATRLRWVAEEAIRIEPRSGERLTAVDWQQSDREVA